MLARGCRKVRRNSTSTAAEVSTSMPAMRSSQKALVRIAALAKRDPIQQIGSVTPEIKPPQLIRAMQRRPYVMKSMHRHSFLGTRVIALEQWEDWQHA